MHSAAGTASLLYALVGPGACSQGKSKAYNDGFQSIFGQNIVVFFCFYAPERGGGDGSTTGIHVITDVDIYICVITQIYLHQL